MKMFLCGENLTETSLPVGRLRPYNCGEKI
jgi:hypothetical protein